MTPLIRFMLGLGCVGTVHTVTPDYGPVAVAGLTLWLLFSGRIGNDPSPTHRSGRLILSGRNI